jgi:methylmalonyl-CoA mutase N-terminal domain/subunit
MGKNSEPMFGKRKLEEMIEEAAAWESRNTDSFGKEPKGDFRSDSDIPLKRLYTPIDLQEREFDYMKDLGFPGDYPFTRGIDPSMYRKDLPKFRQYSGFSTPEETNVLFKNLIDQGQTGFSIAFDLPTQLGYDSDDARAHGEVGKTGVVVNSLKDWEKAFEGVDVSDVFINPVANAQAAIIFAMILCLAEKRGLDPRQLKGSLQNDILKEFTTRGNFIFPVRPSLRLVADIIEYCARHVPQFWPVNVCGIHYTEAGANRVHEGAFVLATAFAYLEEVLARGLSIDEFACNFSFAPSQNHTDFFGEIAKLRAMRRLWARSLKEKYGAKNPRTWMMRMSAINGGSVMTRQQPECNTVRNTVAGLIGFLAGAQQSSLRTIDEVFGIPSEEAQILTTRIQQVLLYETNITSTIDPLGGSYYVESLTSDYEARIGEEIARIEAKGGMAAAVEGGYVQRVLARDAYEAQKKFERGEIIRVGSNKFVMKEKARKRNPYRADPKVEEQQISKLRELREGRNHGEVRRSLDALRKAAEEPQGTNLIPWVKDCVKNYATVGEICTALRAVFGEYKEPRLF